MGPSTYPDGPAGDVTLAEVVTESTVAYGSVRISPDGALIAWYRPESDDDAHPWLTISEDPFLGVETGWVTEDVVADWVPLVDHEAAQADDAHLAAAGEALPVDEARAAVADPDDPSVAAALSAPITDPDDVSLLAEIRALSTVADPVPTGLDQRVIEALNSQDGGESR